MRSMVKPGFVLGANLSLAVAAGAGGQEVLDQEYDPQGAIGLSSGVSADIPKAQTFTVGVSGVLSRVELYMEQVANLGTLLFDVRDTTPIGTPIEDDTQVLVSVAVPVASLPTRRQFVSFDVSSAGIQVERGDLLAIALSFGTPAPASCSGPRSRNAMSASGPSSRSCRGIVDMLDLFEVIDHLGQCADPGNCPWDVDSNGVVNSADVAAVASHFGPCP